MKFKYIYAVFIVFGLFCFLGLAKFGFMQEELGSTRLKLVVKSSKTTYLLGEVVPLSVELTNKGESEVIIENTIDPVYGSLKFYVSNDSKSVNYEYMNPKWGILEVSSVIKIKADEKITNSKNVLSRLKSNSAVEYFFQNAGTYSLKASYQIHYAREAEPVLVESEPIQITVEEPTGEDLEVWNRIKDNGEIAYFIQEGDFRIPTNKTEKRAKFQKEIEQIINQYPNSFYAESLQQSLSKFRTNEEKRQKFLQKIQKEKENPQ